MTERTLLDSVIDIAKQAGNAIMAIHDRDFEVEEKEDHSPLTEADLAAHGIIREALAQLTPQWPILSEESPAEEIEQRKQWSTYWLVDPLDGTKEFIRRSKEFTVNIALIRDHEPVMGVILAPASGICWYGSAGQGAFMVEGQEVQQLRCRPASQQDQLRVVGSRSHKGASTEALVERLRESEWQGIGSSLKFCLIAEGRADFYPRLGPTSEWDTAAAQLVLEEAGGSVRELNEDGEIGARLLYNTRDSLLNPFFAAAAVSDDIQGFIGLE
ncbi:3'(2'),5'-bisphosphate nucleotidase CysQ [Kushneria phosphatilytica]|uniref:3'(2'),5'-bisphosphate nucleotidase CysQ n=1 Tax=Kushneria phosphatilytica TaxID=657387 RepID=A0A1S1NX50_9GAMM|nr:3'(2'),5'-bisphosphate nucleotidase CysQ [Kushneria phosphatilytica]OHV12048.1 3'(2'),5'-bisphosphate nucleotidase [Kushneria phosphatilytica]QEL11238.1 3'(2'),5'-bisphosphate nucleotidase CysQ [Kushneria phosphatilytica]